MRDAKRWVLLAAGSLAIASVGYACAVGTTGDCGENGTCEPQDGGGNVSADGADEIDSPAPPGDTGGSPDRAAEATAGDASSEGASDGGGSSADASDAGAEAEAGSQDGASGDVGPDLGPVCDSTKTPSQEPCVIDELYGVFVSPNGNDANLGTRAQPVKTIGRGMDIAKTPGKRVYVCAGTYPENLTVLVSRDGAAVYGGLDCIAWTYAATNKVFVAPAFPGYALQVAGLTTGATFEDIEFDARDAANPGESSVAVFVRMAQNVAFHRVVIVAGKGEGAEGATGADGGVVGDAGGGTGGGGDAGLASNHFAGVLDGVSAMSPQGPTSTSCACPDGTSSTGGQGGVQAGMMSMGQTPAAGLPSYGVFGAGAPGTNGLTCGAGGTAQNGADGPAAPADTPATTLGLLSASGWAPAVGTAGSDGEPGQGGGGSGYGTGGGGGGPSAGGGGACGGCGGAGGKAGAGGGASIALLMYQSAVAVVSCTLTAHDAGNGGPGASGEVGQAGGIGGVQQRAGCPGGGGGSGAGGNGGQAGPGGLSLGIGWQSTSPQIDGAYVTAAQTLTTTTQVTLGKAGTGGLKGVAGPAALAPTGHAGNDGANGASGTAAAVMGL